MRSTIRTAALATVLTLAGPARPVGIPVIDVTAITQLIQQVLYWQQQINAMSAQLNQLRQTYSSITGSRGMEAVLPTSTGERNYLPTNYAELMGVVNGSSASYAGLAQQVQAAMQANAVLSNAQMQGLSPEMRQLVERGRQSAALIATLSHSAYQNTSQRFAALQQLIAAIGVTTDQKAIEELQARVNAEQAMLANEQAKLQALQQVAQAEQVQAQQRSRERSAADIGSVNSLSSVRY